MKVVCKINSGYYNLRVGREYEVKEFIPRLITPNFTFPRYVTVIDDNGKESTGHAYRFETLEGQSCEEYMKENLKDIEDRNY